MSASIHQRKRIHRRSYFISRGVGEGEVFKKLVHPVVGIANLKFIEQAGYYITVLKKSFFYRKAVLLLKPLID